MEKINPFSSQDIDAGFMWPVERHGGGKRTVEQLFPNKKVVVPKQTHSSWVEIVDQNSPEVIEKVDGLVTRNQRVALAVIASDCQILLAYDEKNRIVGAAHAGWRGIYDEISGELIRKMKKAGADNTEIKVIIGPSINLCCFEVDGDQNNPSQLLNQFQEKFGEEVGERRNQKSFVDLREVQNKTLINEGILEENIMIDPTCTVCDPKNLPSHRREGSGREGNIVGWISLA